MLLEDFGDDWYSRVNGVRNHKHESFGCGGGNSGGKIADDSGIDLSIASRNRGGASVSFTCFPYSIPEQSGWKQTNLEEILPTCV